MKKIIAVLILLLVSGCTVANSSKEKVETKRFEDVITDVFTDCWQDGWCGIITKNGCQIVTEGGGLSPAANEVKGDVEISQIDTKNVKENVGKKVSVYVKVIKPESLGYRNPKPDCALTVFGDKEYYVRVVN